MTYFTLHQNGQIRVSGQIDVFNRKMLEDNNPDYIALEITEEEYNTIKSAQENFYIIDKKIQEKSQKEKDDIQKIKDDWIANNTLRGLQKQVADMSTQLSTISAKIKLP